MPAAGHGGMLLGMAGQGAAPVHCAPRGPCWPQGVARGEYAEEEQGEPPTGCVGYMERIWEVDSVGFIDSGENELEKLN